MADFSQNRYERNFETLKPEDQERLAQSRVCILGLGGLGGGVCENLARIGVGALTLVDGDAFDPTNLNRQLLSREDLIGVPKAHAARDRVQGINSQVQVRCETVFGDAESLPGLLKDADLVVDCLDTIQARFLLQDAAQAAGIPIVSGAIAGVCGQVTVIHPQDKGFELIYGPRDAERNRGIESRTGNISHCALLVACLQASEAVKVLLNRGQILRNQMLILDLWSNTFETVDLV
ncbi:MAG: HesA/MoeB/ThiF family protein [Desulfobacterales bacterium]|nr:HesA/MoeB/ThiF family protein [Desulfobacterales bacterium]